MLEAAKFGDPVIGVDIHMVLVPAPPSPTPIPTPLPHPFVGVVFDPIGAALGAVLGLALGGGGPVLINSMPCGNTGTDVKGVPHFPTPPGVSFAPNDIPSNDGTLVFGSQTVTMAGSSIARLTDLVMTCNFPINLPTSVCMAVPMGAPVLVGGPPSLNLLAALTKAIRTKWFSDLLHKITGGRFSKIICALTGHPVDVMTGEVLTDRVDFELPGALPLKFTRDYGSRGTREGALGRGWTHALEMFVHEEDVRLVVRLADGRERHHPRLPHGASLWDDADRYTLERPPRATASARSTACATSDGQDRVARFRYGILGCLVERIDAAGGVVKYEYDTELNLTGVVNERGERYAIEYDRAGRAVRERGFDGSVRECRHDRAGRLVAAVAADGRAVRLERDACGRLARYLLPDGDELRYEYDPRGDLIAAATADASVLLERDALGRVVRETAGNVTVESHHDPDGLRTRRASSLGYAARYTFDGRGLLRAVSLGAEAERDAWRPESIARGLRPERPFVVHFTRDGAGRELSRTFPADVRATWERDPEGRPRVHEVRRANEPLSATSYQWRTEDELAMRVDAERGPSRFEHDPRGFAVASRGPDGDIVLRVPDAAGDLYRTLDRSDRDYAPGGVLRRDGDARLVHDAQGRLTERSLPDGRRWRYGWDGLGQLRRVTRPDGSVVRFSYDALGRRVRKTVGDDAVEYVWDGNELLHEVAPGGAVVTWAHEPGGVAPLAKVESGRRYGAVTDHLGAPWMLLDEAGEVAWKAQLDLFGVPRTDVARTGCPWRFPGQYEDPETGLYYNRSRYYDPRLGRYLSPDPIGLAGGLALYAYVSDPLWEIDLLGLSGCSPFDDPEVQRLAQRWGRGTFNSVEDCILYHFEKHGTEVGADSVLSYLRKAEGMASRGRALSWLTRADGSRIARIGSQDSVRFMIQRAEEGVWRIMSFGRNPL